MPVQQELHKVIITVEFDADNISAAPFKTAIEYPRWSTCAPVGGIAQHVRSVIGESLGLACDNTQANPVVSLQLINTYAPLMNAFGKRTIPKDIVVSNAGAFMGHSEAIR